MPGGGLAYYNCGEHSGASQPHKHVQIVPLPLADALPDETSFAGLIRSTQTELGLAEYEAFELRCLPFRSYAAVLQPGYAPFPARSKLRHVWQQDAYRANSWTNKTMYLVTSHS
jgi:hypothetical protein